MPASWKSQSNSTPVASSTRLVASASSGPVPSPRMKVTLCVKRVLSWVWAAHSSNAPVLLTCNQMVSVHPRGSRRPSMDRIEREVTIDAPPERVWELVTGAEHLGRWFGDAGAEEDLRPGGELALHWSEYGTSKGRIEAGEAPRVVAVRRGAVKGPR